MTPSQHSSHVILAALGYYDTGECETGASHIVHIKLDGYQDWIASQAYIKRS